jgi:NAD(P)-dependent dehydrogenase (short-subunit alcohol dehydrogenase family)
MRQVLVVGGAGGLGAAVVKQLLDRGLAVLVVGKNKVTEPRVSHARVLDATSVDWRALYRDLEEESGASIDDVVFVAGSAIYGKTALIPAERARQVFELNFWACSRAAVAVGEYWRDRGRPATFLAVLSLVARRAVPFEAYYAASKAAAARFMECLQLEYGDLGIRFVCAFPGTLQTSFRQSGDWYGIEPSSSARGSDVAATARALDGLLESRRKARVIGWRERSIDLADRIAPGLYDRIVLNRRVKRTPR